ncbi:MAG: DUF4926 domain-containing protein [Phycisphaerales bacterium]|nr:DUF4926 domain-containing protein [Phycisphaerales bacterium]
MLREHDVVTVTEDITGEGIVRGDVGIIVHCYPDQDAYEVEILDEQGKTKGVVTVMGDRLLRLNLKSLVA